VGKQRVQTAARPGCFETLMQSTIMLFMIAPRRMTLTLAFVAAIQSMLFWLMPILSGAMQKYPVIVLSDILNGDWFLGWVFSRQTIGAFSAKG